MDVPVSEANATVDPTQGAQVPDEGSMGTLASGNVFGSSVASQSKL